MEVLMDYYTGGVSTNIQGRAELPFTIRRASNSKGNI